MRKLWLKYAAKIDALRPRERAMVFATVLLVGVYLVFVLAIEPSQRRQQVLRKQMEQQKTEIAALHTRAQPTPRQSDPDAANRARGDELKRQLDTLDETLKAMQRDLVPADRMNPLLREMLTRDGGLQLIALRTLPVAPLVARPEKAGAAATAPPAKSDMREINVYKHGMEITLQGSYASLHDYLKRLEQSPWRMFWWRGHLAADEDARLTMTVTIHTLSLDKAWLQV